MGIIRLRKLHSAPKYHNPSIAASNEYVPPLFIPVLKANAGMREEEPSERGTQHGSRLRGG
jgi:hypothetical protein